MPDAIATDKALSPTQQKMLGIVLDMIVPADPQRSKPSAADVGVLDYLAERYPEILPTIAQELAELDAEANATFRREFLQLPRESQDNVVNRLREANPRFLMALAFRAVERYYLDNRVKAAIGLPSRAPFPDGFTVEPRINDALLEPVRKRGSIWRRADIERIKDA